MNKFSERLAVQLYGRTAKEAIAAGECLRCHGAAHALTYSEAGAREYQISGVCEQCFDELLSDESLDDV